MSIRTMGSQGGALQGPKSQSLTRQGSVYSLTLDEVQSQLGDLGKPLGSMNLDELLKSVWTAELNQPVDNAVNTEQQHQIAVPLQSQSSLTLSGDLSKKTVDEVWRDIQHKKGNNQDKTAQDRQRTLGEMTLEDFLVKAGVVAETESSPAEQNPVPVLGATPVQHSQWMHYQLPAVQQQHQPNMIPVFMPGHPVQQPLPISSTQMLDVAYQETQMTVSPSGLVSTLSDTQTPGRKRVASGGVVEKTVERRQKRMIKNRESAARSRARKQAYTQELENKVSRLEEENERLRKQRDMEKVLPCVPPPEPKYQLRRTSSAPF